MTEGAISYENMYEDLDRVIREIERTDPRERADDSTLIGPETLVFVGGNFNETRVAGPGTLDAIWREYSDGGQSSVVAADVSRSEGTATVYAKLGGVPKNFKLPWHVIGRMRC